MHSESSTGVSVCVDEAVSLLLSLASLKGMFRMNSTEGLLLCIIGDGFLEP